MKVSKKKRSQSANNRAVTHSSAKKNPTGVLAIEERELPRRSRLANGDTSNSYSMEWDELRTLAELAFVTGYSADYLRQLAETGSLVAKRIGPRFRGFWISTQQAVREYQAAKHGSGIGGPRGPRKST
jgi:hypothetical protein